MKKFLLTSEQQSLWIEWKLTPNNKAYNLAMQYKLHGNLDLIQFKEAIKSLKRQSEELRSYFVEECGVPYQIYLTTEEIKKQFIELEDPELPDFYFIDLTSIKFNAKEQLSLAFKYHKEAIRKIFNLTHYPLTRFTIIKYNTNEYLFSFVTSHIISDGYSSVISLKMLTEFYKNNCNKSSSSCEFNKTNRIYSKEQYLKYIQKTYTSEVINNDKKYWAERLKNSNLQITFGLPNKITSNRRLGKRIYFNLEKKVVKKLLTVVTNTETTLFIILTSLYAILLSRYTGNKDLILSYPSTTRPRLFDWLTGCFVNNLLLRINLSDDLTFAEIIQQITQSRFEDKKHKYYPYANLIKDLRANNHEFYAEVSLSIAETKFGFNDLNLINVKVTSTTIDYSEVQNDLSLLYDYDKNHGDLYLAFEYRSSLFEDVFIQQLQSNFKVLISSALSSPNQNFTKLPLLTGKELHQQLIEWNKIEKRCHHLKSINQLFELQARCTPNKVAITFERKQLTYFELNTKANQLAHYLISLEAGPEKVVGILLERSIDLHVCILAIWKAGAAYVPLNVDYPTERLDYILKNANAIILITNKRLATKVNNYQGKIVEIDALTIHVSQLNINEPKTIATPSNLAYIIYTSGSTGKPKGVMIERRAIVERMLTLLELYKVSSRDVHLHYASYGFDASLEELFLAILKGGKVIITPQDASFDIEKLINIIAQYKVTTINFVPSLLEEFLSILELTNSTKKCISLQKIIVGGEALSGKFVSRCHSLLKAMLFNTYGPTENTIDSTALICKRNVKYTGITPIGRPLFGVEAYILSPELNLMPQGIPGELYVGGNGMARGYLHDPEQTSERFIHNPFANGKLYKTGDLVRYLPDGNIAFIGRVDYQIKLRGYRIELEEIEATLQTHANVAQAAVRLHEENFNSKYLIAYVKLKNIDITVTKEEPSRTVQEVIPKIKTFLMEALPDYMVPTNFIVINEMPLNSNGKIDRKVLSKIKTNITKQIYIVAGAKLNPH